MSRYTEEVVRIMAKQFEDGMLRGLELAADYLREEAALWRDGGDKKMHKVLHDYAGTVMQMRERSDMQ